MRELKGDASIRASLVASRPQQCLGPKNTYGVADGTPGIRANRGEGRGELNPLQ